MPQNLRVQSVIVRRIVNYLPAPFDIKALEPGRLSLTQKKVQPFKAELPRPLTYLENQGTTDPVASAFRDDVES